LDVTLQSLPPAQARLCLETERFLRKLLGERAQGLRLNAAVSGGLDSTALAVILHCLAPRLDLHIHIVHLDHGLRPESGLDRETARKLAHRLNRPFLAERRNVAARAEERGLGVEEAGRIERYEFFAQAREAARADYTALAHHLDDQAEDVLMRLIRGTGWPGLAGMDAYDPTRRILRPLLEIKKARLRAFLEAVGLTWREDASNQDRDVLRNRVRLDILPLIRNENPSFVEAIGRLAAIGRMERDLDNDLAARSLQRRNDSSLWIGAEILADLHPALQLRLCKHALDQLGPGQTWLENLRRLHGASPGSVVQFPVGNSVLVQKNGVKFYIEQS
jgi:tRNA(Ile)-lysidine synthase